MSLKTRLMLMILGLPLLLLALVVGAALALEDRQRHAALRDQLTHGAELVAPALGEALAREDEQALTRLTDGLLALPHVQGLSLWDGQGARLLERGRLRDLPAPTDLDASRLLERDRRWLLQAPLPDGSPMPAWLVLDIDTTPLLLTHYRHLASAGLALMLAGLLLFLAAYATTRRLSQPLEDAGRALDRLALGVVPEQLVIPPAPELAELARRVNDLADHLETAREEMQAQIEQATGELQESMETIEVQNIELDFAHRRALEANRVKSEFLANMSHEIRTPLNGIVGFCRLLGRSRLEPRQREWLDHVQRACDNLLMLVNDVLDFSKLEAGRVELETLPLDMVGLVDEVLGLQAPLAQQKGLQLLGLVYDDVPAGLEGDPLRIRQVLTNLVNNALKFTDQGEVIVRVMLEQAEASQVVLRVSVCDTGMGLTDEARRRLFQAFHQADISHPRQFGGTGLGLAICRQLVEQMGGEINAESLPGKGSTFSFTLPLLGSSESERAPELSLDGEVIVIEEPHPPTHRALAHLLARWGARVTSPATAGSGPAASLVVAGLGHEDLDEARLAGWRRRLDGLGCPALLLVNASPPDLPALPLPHGGEVLGKPVSRTALADAVIRQLAGRPPALPVPAPRRPSASPIRLLVVDDTESNRLLLSELLAGPGLTVTQAASGEEALALAHDRDFDMVLMDIRMAGMDGVETTRALRRLGGAWRRVPIIAVTAHVQSEQHRVLREGGLDDVLIKPLQPQRLARLLEEHLGIVMPPPQAESGSSAHAPTLAEGEEDQELAVVDLELGARLAGGRERLARELLETLVDSLAHSEQAIRDAVARDDEVGLLDALHALNGACRYCGTPRLGLLAETLETRLRSRGLTAVVPLLPDLYAAMGELRAWQAAQPSSTTKAIASASSSESDR
ncbi:two-component system sensor histidine kinase BarA [Halomonas ventosae]|uniref:histidine kinase n=1 Tax=Halomonas ventosae TaxID=229007 RepID=A0A4R6ZK03_9GAMM|nr:ATP-binding protein [Halomonas ventosae]TDR52680.1 two-component system sensor histidine kinase BarA [Halomonas ventosae]